MGGSRVGRAKSDDNDGIDFRGPHTARRAVQAFASRHVAKNDTAKVMSEKRAESNEYTAQELHMRM